MDRRADGTQRIDGTGDRARRIGSFKPDGQHEFVREIELFLRACPGPTVARGGLRRAALQPVEGIPGLEDGRREGTLDGTGARAGRGGRDGYLWTIGHVAEVLHCRPAYLSEASKDHGYSYSEALRWIRFLHGRALRAEGISAEEVARRLAFHDLAGMGRFTHRLTGKSPKELPTLPLGLWVRMGVEKAFL